MRTMRTILISACLLLSTTSPAFAKPAASDWMGKTAVFTNADVLNSRGASLAPAVLGAIPETLVPVSVSVLLVDRQGLTQVEVVCHTSGIYEMQNGTNFTRRASLNAIHESVLAAVTGKTGGEDAPSGGVFGTVQAPASAGEKMVSEFIRSREAEDVVITLGWIQKGDSHIYGNFYADKRIELNPNAPTATKK